MISKRLKEIGEYVENNAYILDVGCDHALLDIYLVKEKNVLAIASDINPKPLEIALKNIKKYHLESKIKIENCDGLENINNKVDTVILSGLGTTTIINIIKKSYLKISNVKHFIIESNNDYYLLRKSMVDLGFIINKEKMIIDKNKYYLIIDFIFGKDKYSKKELKYGKYIKLDKVYINYLKNEIIKKKNILKNLKLKHLLKRIEINKEIKEMKNIINNKK